MNPFSDKPADTLSSLGEKKLLKEVRRWLGAAAPASPLGMGDDCAVIPADEPCNLITTDSVVLGRHFEASTPPARVGEKLLKRNLSDIAAMGGKPTRAVIAGLLPGNLHIAWLEQCLGGMRQTAMKYGVLLVGGDLAETPSDLALNLTLLGFADFPILRSRGVPGDWVCVTGKLGGSALGRHLGFVPRLSEGQALAIENFVHACIDVSDGLAIDLLNLLNEAVSAELDPDAIPVHEDALTASRESGREPLDHALNDGEDHELLFLMEPVPEAEWKEWQESFVSAGLAPVSRIGKLTQRAGHPLLNAKTGKPFPHIAGYDHFQ